jgi:hypothetical protein
MIDLTPWHHPNTENRARLLDNLEVAPSQPQGSEQQPYQPPEFVNVDEISSPDTTPASPTPIVEESQQKTLVGMDLDVPEQGQGQQDENAGNQVHLENPKEASRVNGIAPNQAEMTVPKRSQTTTPEQPKEGTMEDVTGLRFQE